MPIIRYRNPTNGTFAEFPAMLARVVTTTAASVTAGSALRTDYVYLCTAALTITLPTAVGNGNRYTIKRSGSGNITIATTSSQTIDGTSTYTISVTNQAIDIISDGTNWAVI